MTWQQRDDSVFGKIYLPQTHILKTWKHFYNDVVTGIKKFELRKNDRDFKVGDILILVEVDPLKELQPTGKQTKVKIIYMLVGEQWGLQPNYAILGIETIPDVF